MNLVRMTFKGVPKFIRATDVTRICVDEDGTRVDYGPDEFDFCDGTPDEVFKALFNPPEMIEKARVEEVLSVRHLPTRLREGLHYSEGGRLLGHFIAEMRKALGLPENR